MKGTKPLWLRIREDWVQCNDADAQGIATFIIRSNPYYWALPDYELEAWSKELFWNKKWLLS